jgi:acetyl esterase/lipase
MKTIFILLLSCSSLLAQQQQGPPTQYGTADDGTVLRWQVSVPNNGQQQHPTVILIPGGGFMALGGIPYNPFVSDLVAAGYLVFDNVQYRLAPPNRLPGQVSDGRFPNQTDDVSIAAKAAVHDARCNGDVFVIGGSAGGSHAIVLAARNLVRAAVALSPATQFDDEISLQNRYFSMPVRNYAPDLAAASPNNMMVTNQAPLLIASFSQDSMPPRQYTLSISRLISLGAPYESQMVPGSGHSWRIWPSVRDQIITFLNAHQSAAPTPSPKPPLLLEPAGPTPRPISEMGKSAIWLGR